MNQSSPSATVTTIRAREEHINIIKTFKIQDRIYFILSKWVGLIDRVNVLRPVQHK